MPIVGLNIGEVYEPLMPRPQVVSILVVTIFIAVLGFVYYKKVKKQPVDVAPSGFVLLVQMYVAFLSNMVLEILGPKFQKVIPVFIFLFTYILICNTIIGIVGFENPTSSLTVTFSLGLLVWIGTFVVGFRFQKLSYLKHFCLCISIKKKNGKLKIPVMINPLELVSTITPLISISMRLWGNIFAGSLINLLWFYLWAFITHNVPFIGEINLLAGLTIPPITMYFDLLCGTIQTLVFVTLTMIYWKQASGFNQPEKNTTTIPS